MLSARIDGSPRPLDQATISVFDDGLLRGDGVFEVLRVYSGLPFAVDEHLTRMAASAAGLRLDFDPDGAAEDVAALTELSRGGDALIRLVQTRGGRRIAILEPAPHLPAAVRLVSLTFGPSGLLNGLKTISYAANALATRLAVERGADEALLVSPDGHVLEGPNFAAFFALPNESCLLTPPLTEPILNSITRRTLMALLPIAERRIDVTDLPRVTEAFVASTVREVLPVSAIDGRPLAAPPGPLTAAAVKAFASRVSEQQYQPSPSDQPA